MPLVSKYDFVGELDIPRTGDANVAARLNLFIDKYEREFLRKLFGEGLYADYVTGTTVAEGETMATLWANLQTLLPNMTACYVYFHWMRDAAQQNTGIGVTEAKAENARVVSGNWKMIRAWNEMAEEVAALYDYLDTNRTTYPNWNPAYRYNGYGWFTGRYSIQFAPINAFNI